jgi:D-3-phosphoglycerate dehydrogenase / 2-oxoglutarate reductase
MSGAASEAPIILVTDVDWDGLDIELEHLADLGYEIVLAPDASEETLVALAPRARVILVCFATLTESAVRAATNAGAIFRYGVGVDNIATGVARERGIPVYNVPDYCIDEVADHALLMMVAMFRHLPAQLETMRTGGWSMPDHYPTRIQGLTLGLVGMGRTAQALARRASALGMTIVYTQSQRALPSDIHATRIDDREQFLARSDVVSLHVPLTPENASMVDGKFLAGMKRSALLLNVSRGGLVDSDALASALREGVIAGACLDVTNPEPLPANHPLRSLPQCLITPHFAYRSREALTELRTRISQGASAHLRGGDPEVFVSRAN